MSCGCGSCTDCANEIITLNEGQDGQDGLFGGYSALWQFETNTGSPPSSTYIRMNNADISLATEIYIHETNKDSIDHSSFLNEISSNGLIKIWKQYNSSVFWFGKVVSITDSGSYRTITVTVILTNGTFVNNDNIVFSYTPTGTAATTSLLVNDFNISSTQSLTFASLDIETIPANTLVSNGDMLEVYLTFRYVNASVDNAQVRVQLNNTNIFTGFTEYYLSQPDPVLHVKMQLSRVDNNNVFVRVWSWKEDLLDNMSNDKTSYTIMSGFTLSASSFTIDIDGLVPNGGAEIVYLDNLLIKKYSI